MSAINPAAVQVSPTAGRLAEIPTGSTSPAKLKSASEVNVTWEPYRKRCGTGGRLGSSGTTGPTNCTDMADITGDSVTVGITGGLPRLAVVRPRSCGVNPSATTQKASGITAGDAFANRADTSSCPKVLRSMMRVRPGGESVSYIYPR